MPRFDQGIFAKNLAVTKKPKGSWYTKLSAKEEQQFRGWVKNNRPEFDPEDPTADYDMRGFWKGLMTGDPHATMGVSPLDGKVHLTDYWKTPYHKSFSRESQYATPMAGAWNEKDQLINPMNGAMIFDEPAYVKKNKR